MYRPFSFQIKYFADRDSCMSSSPSFKRVGVHSLASTEFDGKKNV